MPHTKKVTEKVFAEIAETPKKNAKYTTFLDIDKIMGIDESPDLMDFKEMYYELVNDNKDTISSLAALEELIIQIRCKEVVDSELIVYLSRNYIYARTTFYRRTAKINDIRVLIGKSEDFDKLRWGTKIRGNENFRKLCILKLTQAMDKEIESNKITLKILMKV